jgi:flagellar hook-associated protein 2
MLGVVSDPKSTVETYGATLVGNSIVSSVRNQVREMVVGNSSSPSGTFKALRDIGLSIDKTGQLQVDATKLDSALQGNFDDVVKLLSNNRENQSKFNPGTAGVAGEAYRKLVAMLDPSGTLSTQSTNQGTKITAYQKQLDALEARMQVLLKRYTEQFSAMDSLVGRIKSTQSGLKSSFDGMMAAYTSK